MSVCACHVMNNNNNMYVSMQLLTACMHQTWERKKERKKESKERRRTRVKGFQVNGSQEGGTRGAPCPLRGAVRCSAVQCGAMRCGAVVLKDGLGLGLPPVRCCCCCCCTLLIKPIYLFIYLLSCPSRLSPVEKIYILTSVQSRVEQSRAESILDLAYYLPASTLLYRT